MVLHSTHTTCGMLRLRRRGWLSPKVGTRVRDLKHPIQTLDLISSDHQKFWLKTTNLRGRPLSRPVLPPLPLSQQVAALSQRRHQ